MRVSSRQTRQAILVDDETMVLDVNAEALALFNPDGSPVTLEGVAGPVGPVGPRGPAGVTWKGDYDPGSPYDVLDAVYYQGSSYRAGRPIGPGDSGPTAIFGLFPGSETPTTLLEPGTTHSALNVGDPQVGTAYSEYYRFTVETAGTVTIAMLAHGNFDSEMWLYNGVGGLVAHNDDDTFPGSSAYDARIANVNLTPGMYFVRASTHSASQTGAYDLEFTLGTAVLGEDDQPWILLASKGEAGAAGAAGGAGPQGIPGAGVVWRGAWAAGTDYVVDNAVTYNGSSYRVTVAHTPGAGENPAATPGKYAYIAMKGADGAAGAAGANGAAGAAGAAGVGVPAGGTTGKVLAKKTNADYDTEWVAAGAGAGGPSYKGDWNVVTAYLAGEVVKYNFALWEAQANIAAGAAPAVGGTAYTELGGNLSAGGATTNSGNADGEQPFTVNANAALTDIELQGWFATMPAGTVVQIRNAARDTVLASGTVPAGGIAVGAWGKIPLTTPMNLVAGTTYHLRVMSGNWANKANPAIVSGIVSAVGNIWLGGAAQYAYSGAFRLGYTLTTSNSWSKMITENATKYKGNFSAAVAYVPGDLVKSASALWEAKVAVAASATVPAEGANWTKLLTDGGAGGPKFKGDYSGATAYSSGDLVRYGGSVWEAQSATVAGSAPSLNPSTIQVGGNHIAGGTNVNFGGGNNEQTFTVNATTVVSELEIQLYNGGLAAGAVAEIRNAARDTTLATGLMTGGSGGDWIKAVFNSPVTLVAGTTYVWRVYTGNAGAKANPAVPSGIVSAVTQAYANGGAQGAYTAAFKLNGPIANPWSRLITEASVWGFMETFDTDLSSYTDLVNKAAASIAAGKMTNVASTISTGLVLRRAGYAASDIIAQLKITPATVASGDVNVALLGRIAGDNLSWLQGNCNLTGAGTGQLQLYKNAAGTFTALNSQAGITMVAGEDYWLVLRLVGRYLRLEFWDHDPRGGGTAVVGVGYLLTTAELAAFPGTGTGIRSYSAANTKYDEHGVRAATPDMVY